MGFCKTLFQRQLFQKVCRNNLIRALTSQGKLENDSERGIQSPRAITATYQLCMNYAHTSQRMYRMIYPYGSVQPPLYEVCFDELKKEPVWSRHILQPNLGTTIRGRGYDVVVEGLSVPCNKDIYKEV